MKKVKDYEDYMIDMIVESVNSDAPLFFSDNFRSLLNTINHPISTRLLSSELGDGYKQTYIDLDDSGLDQISYLVVNKAVDILSNYSGQNKDEVITRADYNKFRYDYNLKDKLYSTYRTATSVGKLVNKLFPKEFIPGGKSGEDIQSFVDEFKSKRDIKDLELVKGKDIVYWYNSNQYWGNDGNLWTSCMRYDQCENYIQFYADNPNKVSLLILKDKDDNGNEKIKGRALIWNLSDPSGRTFMDRIYTVNIHDETLFKAYAKKEGWLYKFRQNMNEDEEIVDTVNGERETMDLVVDDMTESSTDKYPYCDTLKYFDNYNEIISNDRNRSDNYWTLTELDGGNGEEDEDEDEDEGMYVAYYDEYYPEDDLIWCEMGDEYRLEDDATYCEFYEKSATEQYINTHMTSVDYCENNYDTMRESDDVVEIYGTNKTACKEYAENNMTYSGYYDEYLPEGEEVWSEHHQDYLYEPEAVSVYLNAEQTKDDWRAEDDNTWWEWDHDDEKYDNDVTEDELKEENGLNEEEEEEEEEVVNTKKVVEKKKKEEKNILL